MKKTVYVLSAALATSLSLHAVQGFPTNEVRAGKVETQQVCSSGYIQVPVEDLQTITFKNLVKLGLDTLNADYEPTSLWTLGKVKYVEFRKSEGLKVCVEDIFTLSPGAPSE